MIVWMVYPKAVLENPYGNFAFDWMIESAAKYDIEVKIYFVEELNVLATDDIHIYHNNVLLEQPSLVIMRCYHHAMHVCFETMGVPVINTSKSMFNCRDKSITAMILKKNHIDTPNYLSGTNLSYQDASEILGARFLVKAVDGSGGKDIYLIKNENEYIEASSRIYGPSMCQEYVDTSYGKDIRIYVLGNRVIGGVLRVSDHDFRSNFALGGKAEPIVLNQGMCDLAIKGCQAMGVEFAGVDLLFTEKGYTICEINGNAGFRTLSAVTDVNIGDELFRYIRQTYFPDKH